MRPLRAVQLASILVLLFFSDAQSEPPPRQKAILVTGASTGIGRKVTERLAADGYFVYAGARKDADIEALSKIENVQGIRLDVTKEADIEAALETVKKSGRGLYGLINNAGIGTAGSILDSPPEEFDLAMQVNVGGVWRMTRAFAPLIIESKGRIATTSSISGILAGPTITNYVMSKHAIEGFTDSVAAELAPHGVHVCAIEPGSYKTEIFRSTAKRLGGKYAKQANALDKLEEPDAVAAAFAAAMSEPTPKRRYLIVAVDDHARRTIKKQIEQLVQLNEGHAFTYDRAELIEMLDEALVGSRPRIPAKLMRE